MKILILKVVSLFIAVGLTLAGFFIMPGSYDYALAAIVNKIEMLKHSASPKIIVIGGSEVLVGVDSAMLNADLGYNVVNMGLYAGFGLKHVLHFVEPYVGKNDIVVIIPEYFVLKTDIESDEFAHKWYFLLSPRYAVREIYCKLDRLDALPGDISDMFMLKISGMWQALKRGKNIFQNGVLGYSVMCNKHGDLLKNWTNVPREKLGGFGRVMQDGPVRKRNLASMNDFNDYAVQKGARVFLMFTTYPDGEYELNKNQINKIARECREKLKFTVAGSPEDFIFPYDMFSNTVNHLRFEGRSIRTKRMIDLLKKEGVLKLKAAR